MRSLAASFWQRWRARHLASSSLHRVALLLVAVAVLFGCGATTTIVANQGGGTPATGNGTGGANATTTSHAGGSAPTATSAPHANPTNTPVPPPAPTATKAPTPPNIAGSYGGFFTKYAQNGAFPMQVVLSQSGSTLTGTTTEESYTYSDTGTIGLNGSFTLVEKSNGNFVANLVGSLTYKNAGGAAMEGTWNNGGAALGTWGVSTPAEPAYIVGTYTGSYTESGSTFPMTLKITGQLGTSLTGTTTEGSYTYSDSGTITPNTTNTFTIAESNNGSFVANLVGSITGLGQLGGTWNNGGAALGTWQVTIQ